MLVIDVDNAVRENMPLVGYIVRETMGRVPAQVSRDDLTSAGYVALVQAAKAFDASHGVPFARYAARRIRGAIVDELRAIDWASRSVRRRARELDLAKQSLTVNLQRPPTNQELATAMGLTVEDVTASAEDVARADVVSLDGPGTSVLADMLVSDFPDPQAALEHRERLELMVEAVAQLPDRLRKVIEDYFLLQRPMADIADELHVSESRISQMRAEGLSLLWTAMSEILGDADKSAHRPARSAKRTASYVATVAARHSASVRRAPGVAPLNVGATA